MNTSVGGLSVQNSTNLEPQNPNANLIEKGPVLEPQGGVETGNVPVVPNDNAPTTTEVIKVSDGLPGQVSTEAMGQNEKPAQKQSEFKNVQSLDNFVNKFKQMGSTDTSNVNIQDAVFDLNNIPVSSDTAELKRTYTAMSLEKMAGMRDESKLQKKLKTKHEDHYKSLNIDPRGTGNARRVDNIADDALHVVASHVVEVKKDKDDPTKLYQVGYNGRRYLGFIYSKSGDKVGTHEYANGTMEFGKLGTYFLRVDDDPDNEGKIKNEYDIDAFLNPLEFEKVSKKTVSTFEDTYKVKNMDAGYRFTHLNKRSKESDRKDLDALTLQTVGGHWWNKSVAKYTGMDDVLHMKAIRANFAAAVYDELRYDGVSVPDKIMDDFVGKILAGNYAANGSNQDQTLILRKSEVAQAINELTESFREDEDDGGNRLFDQYVRHNMSRAIADAYHVRCSPDDYEILLKELLTEEQQAAWTPQAIFQRIKTNPDYADDFAAINEELRVAKDEKDASKSVKDTHKAYAKLFQMYLKGLKAEIGRFASTMNLKAVEDTFGGLIALAQNPATYQQGFVIVPGDKRDQVRKLLNGALSVAINKVDDETVRNKLKDCLNDGLDIFCNAKQGAPDFLALELQRIALVYKDVKRDNLPFKMGEIMNEVAKTALEFINGYRTHYEDFRKSEDYVTQRAKLTKNTSKVVKALAKYVEEQTADYLVQYKNAKSEEDRNKVLGEYEKFHGTCKGKNLKGEKLNLAELAKTLPDYDSSDPSKLKLAAANQVGSPDLQDYQFVDVNAAYDNHLKNSYYAYFKERMYTGADLVSQVAKANEDLQKEQDILQKEINSLVARRADNEKFCAYAAADLKNFTQIKEFDYSKEKYPELTDSYPTYKGLQDAINDIKENVESVKAEQIELGKRIEELTAKKDKLTCTLAYKGAIVNEKLDFKSYLMDHDLQKNFDRAMVKTLGETYAALTTFKPMEKGRLTVDQALHGLMDVYQKQWAENTAFISQSVNLNATGYQKAAESQLLDPNASGVKNLFSSFSLKAGSIAEAFDVCIGGKSKDASFRDKFNSIFYVFFGHQLGNNSGSDAIGNKIKDLVNSFGLRTLDIGKKDSLFNALFNGWTKHLVSKHNEGTLDLFDDLLTLSDNATEDDIVNALQNNYTQTKVIKTDLGRYDLEKTLPNVQKQIVSVCLESLKGVSTNFFNLFEKTLVFDSFSGETYAKAKKFRNALTNMTDEQLWSMCSGENETADGKIPREYKTGSSSKRKAFRQTMEAICEYRFMANSIQAIEKAIATYGEMLPSRENEFLEYVEKESPSGQNLLKVDAFAGRKLNKRGLAYLTGVINNAVDGVVAQELERAAQTFLERTDDKDVNDETKKDIARERLNVSKAVLKTTVVGEMYNLNALFQVEQGNVLDKVGDLYGQEGNQWLVENYPMVAQIYGENIGLLAMALEQGLLKDMYNVSIVENIKKASKGTIYSHDIIGNLKNLVLDDISDKAPKKILKFLDEVEQSLSVITEQGKKFYLDNYKKFIANKKNNPNYLQENAGQFAEIESLLQQANVPESQRAELRDRLISHAVERLMGQNQEIAKYVRDTLNYAHFDSFRKNMSEKMKEHMETTRHDFIKDVTANVLTILDEVKVILSHNNREIANNLRIDDFAKAFDGFVDDRFLKDETLAKSQVLAGKVDPGTSVETNVRRSIVMLSQDLDVDVPQLMEENANSIKDGLGLDKACTTYGALLQKLTGQELTSGAKFFEALTKDPQNAGFRDLAERCLAKVQENAQRDPVRYYGQLAKKFEKGEGFNVAVLTDAMRKDAVELFFKLLPQYSQMKARIEEKIDQDLAELEKKSYLYQNQQDLAEFKDRILKIKGQIRAKMLAQIDNLPSYVETAREELTAKRLDVVEKLKDEARENLKGKDVGRMDFGGLVYVDDLEVEDAAVDKMANEVVNSEYKSKESLYQRLCGEIRDRAAEVNRKFSETNVGLFAKVLEEARARAQEIGLTGKNLEAFAEFVQNIAQPQDSSANNLMKEFFVENGQAEPKVEQLRAFIGKIVEALGAQDLEAMSIVERRAKVLTGVSDLQDGLKTYVATEGAQEALLKALKLKFLNSLPADVNEVLRRDLPADDLDAIQKYEDLVLAKANQMDKDGQVRKAFISNVKAKIDAAFSVTGADGLFKTVFGSFYASEDDEATVKRSGDSATADPQVAAFMRAARTFGLPGVRKEGSTFFLPKLGELKKGWSDTLKSVVDSIKIQLDSKDFQPEKSVEETVADLVDRSLSQILRSGIAASAIPDIEDQINVTFMNLNMPGLSDEMKSVLPPLVCNFYRDRLTDIYATDLEKGVEDVTAVLMSFFTAKGDEQKRIASFFNRPVCAPGGLGKAGIPFAGIAKAAYAVSLMLDDFSLGQLYQQIFWPENIANEYPQISYADFEANVKAGTLNAMKTTLRQTIFHEILTGGLLQTIHDIGVDAFSEGADISLASRQFDKNLGKVKELLESSVRMEAGWGGKKFSEQAKMMKDLLTNKETGIFPEIGVIPGNSGTADVKINLVDPARCSALKQEMLRAMSMDMIMQSLNGVPNGKKVAISMTKDEEDNRRKFVENRIRDMKGTGPYELSYGLAGKKRLIGDDWSGKIQCAEFSGIYAACSRLKGKYICYSLFKNSGIAETFAKKFGLTDSIIAKYAKSSEFAGFSELTKSALREMKFDEMDVKAKK